MPSIRLSSVNPTLDDEIASGEVKVQGSVDALSELVSLLDTFDFWFNIVEP